VSQPGGQRHGGAASAVRRRRIGPGSQQQVNDAGVALLGGQMRRPRD
jgi:hypothetical protein